MTTEKKQNKVTDEELVAFEKMQQRVSKNLGELYDRINEETISQAIYKATTELKEAGVHSSEAISKASAALKKDIASTTKYLKPKLDQATEETTKLFDHWLDKGGALWHDIAQEAEHVYELSRDKGGAFLVNVTKGLSEWSQSVGENLDTSLNYKTGEISHGGEFICTNCDGKIHLKHPGRIPPCPKCTKTEFRRS